MGYKDDNYIPEELICEAKNFIKFMNEDVEIYKIFRKIPDTKQCMEADKFIAYWSLARYNDFPHALITLYENLDEINNNFGSVTSENSFDCLQYKMKSYYLLLKENNLIGE